MRYEEEILPPRVVRPWPRLPREAVAAPSLAVLKARLDGAWSTLGWWKGSLLRAGGWNWMSFKVPSNPNYSVILQTHRNAWSSFHAETSGSHQEGLRQRGKAASVGVHIGTGPHMYVCIYNILHICFSAH